MTRGIIFDCDGTLVDSREAVLGFFDDLYAGLGRPPLDRGDASLVELCMGRTDAEVLAELVPKKAERLRAETWAAGLPDEYFLARLALQPGALEILRTLRPAYRLAICTNRRSDMALVARRFGLDGLVDAILTADDVRHPKPHPDMLLEAAGRLGIAPAEMVFVGDTGVDAEAAARAGMSFVCYSRHGLESCSPPRLRDLRDLPTLLDGSARSSGAPTPAG